MNNIFRGLIAGYGAKKLGGGCFGTIIVFILIWVALGQCSGMSRTKPAPEAYPTNRQANLNYELCHRHGFATNDKRLFMVQGTSLPVV